MIKNKKLIIDTINKRKEMNDPVLKYATRNKASPLNSWTSFTTYSEEYFHNVFKLAIDGIKLKFRFTTLTINARHKNK